MAPICVKWSPVPACRWRASPRRCQADCASGPARALAGHLGWVCCSMPARGSADPSGLAPMDFAPLELGVGFGLRPGLNLGTCALPRRLRRREGPAIHQAAPASTVIAAAATNHAVRLDHPLPAPTGPTPVPSKMPAATIPSKGPAIIAVLLIACPSHCRR